MKGRYKRTNDKPESKPQGLSFAELLKGKPTKKMKKVEGAIKKNKKASAPEAFIPHEDDEF